MSQPVRRRHPFWVWQILIGIAALSVSVGGTLGAMFLLTHLHSLFPSPRRAHIRWKLNQGTMMIGELENTGTVPLRTVKVAGLITERVYRSGFDQGERSYWTTTDYPLEYQLRDTAGDNRGPINFSPKTSPDIPPGGRVGVMLMGANENNLREVRAYEVRPDGTRADIPLEVSTDPL